MLRISNNCVTCILNPIVSFGFTLLAILNPKCVHMKSGTQRNLLKFNRINLVISVCCTAVLAIYLIFSYQDLMYAERSTYNSLISGIFGVNALVFTINFYLFNKTYRTCTNSLIIIVEKKQLFGIQTLLVAEKVKGMVTVSIVLLFFCYVYSFMYVLYKCYQNFTLKECICQLGSLIAMITLSSLCTLVLVLFKIYDFLLESILCVIENSLDVNVVNSTKYVHTRLVERLQHLQAFYILLYKNYKKHVLSVGNLFYFLTLFLTSVSLGILFNIYVRDIVMYPNKFDYFEVVDCFIRYGLTYWITFLMFCYYTDKIYKVSQDLLSFLYKYPISKLTELEAAQVEMVIMTLTLEKPELRASNIFTLGTNLLSSKLRKSIREIVFWVTLT